MLIWTRMDEVDAIILSLLQEDSSISNAELGEAVGLTVGGVYKRVKRLREQGIILKRPALLDREKLGYDFLCFATITLRSNQPESYQQVREVVAKVPWIQECFEMTGKDDLLLRIIAKNRRHLRQILHELNRQIPEISRIETSVVLDELKSSTSIPLPEQEDESLPEKIVSP